VVGRTSLIRSSGQPTLLRLPWGLAVDPQVTYASPAASRRPGRHRGFNFRVRPGGDFRLSFFNEERESCIFIAKAL